MDVQEITVLIFFYDDVKILILFFCYNEFSTILLKWLNPFLYTDTVWNARFL